MKFCKTCYRLKDDNDYRMIKRVRENVPDFEGPSYKVDYYYQLGTCKECVNRGKRYKRGNQTERDVFEEINIMLENEKRWWQVKAS